MVRSICRRLPSQAARSTRVSCGSNAAAFGSRGCAASATSASTRVISAEGPKALQPGCFCNGGSKKSRSAHCDVAMITLQTDVSLRARSDVALERHAPNDGEGTRSSALKSRCPGMTS